jgi:TolA-binding protein
MTKYSGSGITAFVVLGIPALLILVVLGGYFGLRTWSDVEASRADKEQARLDVEWERTRQLQLDVELAQVALEQEIARMNAELEELQARQTHEINQMIVGQLLLDHNATMFALASGNEALAERLEALQPPKDDLYGLGIVVGGVGVIMLLAAAMAAAMGVRMYRTWASRFLR